MIESVKTYVRFDIPFKDGDETKRKKYDRLGGDGVKNKNTGEILEAPKIEIPDEYARVWFLFFRLSDQVSRIREGVCGRIPPSEYEAWFRLTKTHVTNEEYELMVDMDEAFCIAMNAELDELRPKPGDRPPKP